MLAVGLVVDAEMRRFQGQFLSAGPKSNRLIVNRLELSARRNPYALVDLLA